MSLENQKMITLLLLRGKAAKGFIVGVVISLSFSIAVILATIGLMDGFDFALKNGLKTASGEILIHNRDGFFSFDSDLRDVFDELQIQDYASIVQTEGFLIFDQDSRGVIVRGIEPVSFSKVTGLKIDELKDGVLLGEEIAKEMELKDGNEIVIAFANGNEGLASLPLLKRVAVKGTIRHGIYEKDARIIYMDHKLLANWLSVKSQMNLLSILVPKPQSFNTNRPKDLIKLVDDFQIKLEEKLDSRFVVRSFWREYAPLIEAVQVEKITISLILQLIVLIAIFNILAFIIYLNEKRAQEIFLLQALGASKQKLIGVWIMMAIFLWALSCLISFLWLWIFNWGLQNLSFLQLPGDVYSLSHLALKFTFADYLLVFGLAFIWISLIIGFGVWRLKKQSTLYGLRRQFS